MEDWIANLLKGAERHGSPKVDVLPDDVRKEFEGKKTRIVERKAWHGDYFIQEIFYKRRWRWVCHTSLFDDVGTGSCARKPEEAMTLESLLSGNFFGARIQDESISIITHMTDG